MADNSDLPKVLFLCTGNSCRSQMAEGWAHALARNKIQVFSAGIEKHGLDPDTVAVMSEVGIDISQQTSKNVEELGEIQLDLVVTVCGHANETCPTFNGSPRTVHIGFEDPPRLAAQAANREEGLAHYRRIRDEIRAVVENCDNWLEV